MSLSARLHHISMATDHVPNSVRLKNVMSCHVNSKSGIHFLIALKQNHVKGELPLPVYEKYGMETSKADSYVWTKAKSPLF
jgi:hypothetical protein